MENKDIRWEQRFANYRKALKGLNKAVEIIKEELYIDEDDNEFDEELANELEKVLKEGLIQRFEYTHELAWNVMKDYQEYQGNFEIKGSRDATREAFSMNLIKDAESWMSMIKSRNDTSHTYNEETAESIIDEIINVYAELFNKFESKMEQLKSGIQQDLFGKEL